jgi:small subunit ribosomal protein S13
MAVLLNTTLKDSKRLVIALGQVHGMGHASAQEICATLGLSEMVKVKDLTQQQQDQLSQTLRHRYSVENERLRLVRKQAKRLVQLSTWRGLRLAQGLPCRGQRTHGNARTARRLNAHRVKQK